MILGFKNYVNGFSLIEILLAMAILLIFASGVATWFTGYQRQTELDSTVKLIVGTLRDAQSRAAAGKDFKNWGVYFDVVESKFVLFRDEGLGYNNGTDIKIREDNYLPDRLKFNSDSINSLADNGATKGVVFKIPGGDTTQFGTIKIEDPANSIDYRNITITPLGLVTTP